MTAEISAVLKIHAIHSHKRLANQLREVRALSYIAMFALLFVLRSSLFSVLSLLFAFTHTAQLTAHNTHCTPHGHSHTC